MAHSNKETIEIRATTVFDGRKSLHVRELYIDNCRRASLEQQRDGSVRFRFHPVGSFQWQEAQIWLFGLLELSMHAEELENGKK